MSLGLNYPNEADRRKSNATNLGSDIFIHGSCVTIGCMPMTDDKIKEIYIYSIEARNNWQLKIPIYIFPFKMTDSNHLQFKNINKKNPSLILFWDNLKTGYDKSKLENIALKIKVNKNGNYLFN